MSMFSKTATSTQSREQVGLLAPCILLLLSGFSALIFQVIWVRQLGTVVGVDVYAISTAISAFMAGLALGALALGRMTQRFQNPFRLYAALEILVALLGAGLTILLPRLAGPFARIETANSILAWGMLGVLIILPAFFMGGTLPAVLESLSRFKKSVPSAGGGLYAANTAGAVVGTLIATFVLIPSLGLFGSAIAASLCSLIAAATALCLSFPPPIEKLQAKATTFSLSSEARAALVLYAIAGGLALGYEVVWTQSIVQFMSTRTFAFSVVLATYLSGIAIGSAVMARFVDGLTRPWVVFGCLIASAGAITIAETAFLGSWIVWFQSAAEYWAIAVSGDRLIGMITRFVAVTLPIILLPTLLLGAAFPVVLRIVNSGAAGRDAGLVSGINTIGSICGTLVVGFYLIPTLGFVKSLAILAIIASLIGIVAFIRDRSWSLFGGVIVGISGVVSIICLIAVPSNRFADLLPGGRGGKFVFYEEGLGASVAVVEQSKGQKFRRLYIQGVSNSGDSLTSQRYMRLQALLPLIISASEPKSSLVIGLGTGITAGATLAYEPLERRVVAELLPGVIAAAPVFTANYNVASDPRIELRQTDGRRDLLANDMRYDLITLEPPPPSAMGVANLYSTDFYKLANSRLKENGLVAQWLPLPTQNQEDTLSLIRSFIDVYPFATLWTTELHEMLLIGANDPIKLDYERMRSRFEQPQVKQALSEVGITSVSALLSTYVTDRRQLLAVSENVPPVTDDNPTIEYSTWTRVNAFERTLPLLMGLASEPPVIGMPANAKELLGTEREGLFSFYQAGLAAYARDVEGWQNHAAKAKSIAPDNKYYNWIFGGEQ